MFGFERDVMFGLCFVPVQTKVNPNLPSVEDSDLMQVFVMLRLGTATGAQVSVSCSVWHVSAL
jgi:hypothetical protein